jgi:hypothetical protein
MGAAGFIFPIRRELGRVHVVQTSGTRSCSVSSQWSPSEEERLVEERRVSASALETARTLSKATRRDVGVTESSTESLYTHDRSQAEIQRQFLGHGYVRVDVVVREDDVEPLAMRWTIVRGFVGAASGIYNLASPMWRAIRGVDVGDEFEVDAPRGPVPYELIENCFTDFEPDGVAGIRNWRTSRARERPAHLPAPLPAAKRDFALSNRFIFRPNGEQEDLYETADEAAPARDPAPASPRHVSSRVLARLVTGVAGSGKTSVALGHLNLLAQQGDAPDGTSADSRYQPQYCLGIALTETLLPSLNELARSLDLGRLRLVSYERGIRKAVLDGFYGPIKRRPGGPRDRSGREMAWEAVRRHAEAVVTAVRQSAEYKKASHQTKWYASLGSISGWLASPVPQDALVAADVGAVLLGELEAALSDFAQANAKRPVRMEPAPAYPSINKTKGLAEHIEDALGARIGPDPLPEAALDVLVLFAVRFRSLMMPARRSAEEFAASTSWLRGRLAGFVDEVQDFDPIQLLVIESLFRSSEDAIPPRLMLAGDFQQSVSLGGVASLDAFPFPIEHVRHLTTNERQTRELNALTASYRNKIQGDERPPQGSGRSGRQAVYWPRDPADPHALPEELWSTMLDGGSWTVICPSDDFAAVVQRRLENRADEWDGRVVMWRATQAVDVSGVSYDFHVGTVKAFKGLEANRVVVLGVESFDLASRGGRDALYVAITRPRDELHLVGPPLGMLAAPLAEVVGQHAEVRSAADAGG